MSGSSEPGSPQTDAGSIAPAEEGAVPPAPAGPAPIEVTSQETRAEPSASPPAPEDEAAERDALLVHGSRAVALASLIGAAVVSWTQLAFRSPWLDELVIDNTLGPDL